MSSGPASAPRCAASDGSGWTLFVVVAAMVVAVSGTCFPYLSSEASDATGERSLADESASFPGSTRLPAPRPRLHAVTLRSCPAPQEAEALPTATDPLSWNDLIFMLRVGLHDEEIIAQTGGMQLVSEIGPAQAATLREWGAGDKLLENMWSRPLYSPPEETTRVLTTVSAQAINAMPVSMGANVPPPFVNYAAKNHTVQSLKEQIDALDEQVRAIRANLKDTRFWWHYYGSGNRGINQAILNQYLDQLDRQRDGLRREKGRLEGR